MKKYFLHFLMSGMLFISGNIYANETKCPPPEMIKKTHFSSVVAWEVLYAAPFKSNGESWNVWIWGKDIRKILEAAYNDRYNIGRAFRESQAYFDAISSYENNYPTPENSTSFGRIICTYTSNENLTIIAFNPPREIA